MFDDLIAARALFGISIGFHIVFATVGIGLPLLLFIAEGLALRTGNQTYLLLAKRWARVFALLFAVGAVSGTVLPFELGLLWPAWMEVAGAAVGFLFTVEGVAFFIEAVFLGLYIYGWDRLSPRAHWLCTVPLMVSSAASAFLVIAVNGWMNQPAGFDFVGGKAQNIDPVGVLFNGAMPYEVTHGAISAYVATGFAVAGVYAIKMLRGDRSEYVKKAVVLGMAVAVVAAPLQVLSGHFSSRFVAHNQPEKFAAMEGQFETEKGAPLRIGGLPDTRDKTTRYAIEIPKLGSFLAFEDFDAEIRGLNSFPEDEIPNAPLVHFPFQIMVGIGFFLLFVALWFWGASWWRRKVDPGRLQLLGIAAAFPLGFLAIEMGWFVTEFGRQPWVIYQVMRTSEGATARGGIDFLLLAFVAVYVALAAGLAVLLFKGLRGLRLPFGLGRTGEVPRGS